MKPSLFLSAALTIFVAASCTNEEPLSNPNSHIPEASDPAFKLVEAFAGKVEYKNLSPAKINFKEKRTTPYYIADYQIADKALSRSQNGEDISVSTIVFDSNGTPGFAVVGESKSLTKLYFFTSNGTPEDIREISPAANILDSIPYYFASDIAAASIIGGPINPGIYPPLDSIAGWNIIGPIATTQWGQDYPYNTLAPLCTDHEYPYENHNMPIGCGAVALGQFFAKQGHYIASDGTAYDLTQVGAKNKPSTNDEEDVIASFLYELATRLSTNYSCSVSTTYFSYFPQILHENGYTTTYVYGDIDDSMLVNELLAGYPHLIRGARRDPNSGSQESGGHFWIIDGIYGNFESPYYHCNWGWNGLGNCWTVSTPYKAQGAPNYYDTGFIQIYTGK